ncbi:MAG: hypothetical protein NXI03_11980, partial [Alphaproteobacteria bacterium]|nr:hypothetical protein [Alphaproteobacteria bacterium]
MGPLRFSAVACAALAILGAAAVPASADFLWFRTPKEKPTLSIVIEDNVRGGCLRDRGAVIHGIGVLLDGHGIEVAESSTINLVIYAVGHPASN